MSVNNTIHIIRFTPRKYVIPVVLLRDYLLLEDGFFLLTEDNKKIRL
jgi:hypothetical protein